MRKSSFAVANMLTKRLYIKYLFVCLILYTFIFVLQKRLKTFPSGKECALTHNATKQFIKIGNEISSGNIPELEYDGIKRRLTDSQNMPHLWSILKMCGQYNLRTPLVKRHYLHNPNNTSMYCWIRKVASTSFIKLFSDMRNRSISKDYYKEIDVLSPKTIKELEDLVNDSKVFKFLVIRHPFQRIVSSYRDRIEDNTKYTAQAWKYTKMIFHLTRPEIFYKNGTTGSSLNRIFHNNKRLKLVPTFKEFVTWLLQEPTSNDDVHWDSYYSHCSVCDVKYNFVMKLEDYSIETIDFIFSKMGITKNQFFMPRLQATRNGFTDNYRTCSYFKDLTQETIFKLYQRYKIDFQMFNYTHENYLKCAH
ncbi:carbohydrate sulfotransferase 11-like [Neodiprion fabricii]|uniref:carbohydrate sulfotransferase 11-like n=1 Tax=Neodiprion fabricii TaxID=2872261 RepID=UPI001ED8D7F5|nr:carbohydrate sulfotransferase 11-like [Neodiprion fabricii]